MAERFYVNCPLAPGSVVLEGPEAHHLAHVCRLRPGDLVYLFNGDGSQYSAEVTSISRRLVELDVKSVEQPKRELPFHLELAAPLPKGDRGQFLVEKLTELGVTRFVPLRTSRSVVHPSDNKLDKLQRTVIEASKQCGRNTLMRVEPMADWETYCRGGALPATRLIAHPAHLGTQAEVEWSAPHNGATALAVGPEGGFTDQEVDWAEQADWQAIDLGARILRVETAAVVVAVLAISRGLKSLQSS